MGKGVIPARLVLQKEQESSKKTECDHLRDKRQSNRPILKKIINLP